MNWLTSGGCLKARLAKSGNCFQSTRHEKAELLNATWPCWETRRVLSPSAMDPITAICFRLGLLASALPKNAARCSACIESFRVKRASFGAVPYARCDHLHGV